MGVLSTLLRFGRDPATVPSMDGALRPNQALDQADELARIDAPDDVVCRSGEILFSAGSTLYRSASTAKGDPEAEQTFDATITALAAAPNGGIAVALDGKGIVISGGPHDGATIDAIGPASLSAITAMTFADDDTLFVCIGSERLGSNDWQRDLLDHGESGSVWRIRLGGGDTPFCIAQNLTYPNGVLVQNGQIVISEAWKHRLLSLPLSGNGRVRVVLDDLPGYPGRLSARPGGGAWLAVFAPRTQLLEFVLKENAYRRTMMETMDENYWIAPTLRSGQSFKEPTQLGAVKTLGIHKPWAPTRSYGLVVRLDADFVPVASLHSRSDGHRHGVTASVECGGRLIVSCRGDGVVVAAGLAEAGETPGEAPGEIQ